MFDSTQKDLQIGSKDWANVGAHLSNMINPIHSYMTSKANKEVIEQSRSENNMKNLLADVHVGKHVDLKL